jgi:hypothetical protein
LHATPLRAKPELLEQFKPTQFELHLMEHGGEVEVRARKLFTHGRLIIATGDEACLETRQVRGESGDAFFSGSIHRRCAVLCVHCHQMIHRWPDPTDSRHRSRSGEAIEVAAIAQLALRSTQVASYGA